MPSPPPSERLRDLTLVVLGAALVGVLAGSASALFLALLDLATRARERHEELIFALPVAGLVIGLVYDRVGKPSRGGMDIVLDATFDEQTRVPKRMAPLVLLGTVLTHLFGGSAGREGTAVQMGGSLAELVGRGLGARGDVRRKLLLAGIAGGFSSVFGTPFAGVVFALEVPTVGKLSTDALLPALVASVVGDMTARAWGTTHATYLAPPWVAPTPLVVVKLVGLALVCAACSVAFVGSVKAMKHAAETRKIALPVRMATGGAVVALLAKVFHLEAYLGLGVPTIQRAFHDPSVPKHAFAIKLCLTAITIGSGFLGGEVTPLFFVGATCGAAYASVVALPLALGAACGMAAVFGASANTPIALSIMVVELVGATAIPYVLMVSVIAFLVSGERGIYGAQRFAATKGGKVLAPPVALRDLDRATTAAKEKTDVPDGEPPAPA